MDRTKWKNKTKINFSLGEITDQLFHTSTSQTDSIMEEIPVVRCIRCDLEQGCCETNLKSHKIKLNTQFSFFPMHSIWCMSIEVLFLTAITELINVWFLSLHFLIKKKSPHYGQQFKSLTQLNPPHTIYFSKTVVRFTLFKYGRWQTWRALHIKPEISISE